MEQEERKELHEFIMKEIDKYKPWETILRGEVYFIIRDAINNFYKNK